MNRWQAVLLAAVAVAGLLVPGCGGPARSPAAARLRRGLGYLSEDRKGEGLALALSIADNTTMTRMRACANGWGWLNLSRQKQQVDDLIAQLKIKARTSQQPARTPVFNDFTGFASGTSSALAQCGSNNTAKEDEDMKRTSALAIFLGTALLAGAASAAVAPAEDIQAPRTSSQDIQAPRTSSQDIQAPRTGNEDIQAPRTSSQDIQAPRGPQAAHDRNEDIQAPRG